MELLLFSFLINIALLTAYDYYRVYKITIRVEEEITKLEILRYNGHAELKKECEDLRKELKRFI